MDEERIQMERLTQANTLIEAIASHGYQFFRNRTTGKIASLELDHRGRVWFLDEHSLKRIYTHQHYLGRGFTNGGTLNDLVRHLRDYVKKGVRLPNHVLGPWPEWICNRDLWGYGAEMENVRDTARKLGLLRPKEPAQESKARA